MIHFGFEKYLGKPYKHLGRTLEGFDCLGLIKLILIEAGHGLVWHRALTDLGEHDIYQENWGDAPDGRMGRFLAALGAAVDVPYESGDLMLYDSGTGVVDFAGIYLPGGYLLCMDDYCMTVKLLNLNAVHGFQLKSVIRVA